MKPTIHPFAQFWSISGRRWKLFSALVMGFMFLSGMPVRGLASPGLHGPVTEPWGRGGLPYLALHITVSVINDQVADGNSNDVVTITVTDDGGNYVDGVNFYFQIENTSLIKKLTTGDGFSSGTVSYSYATTQVGATNILIYQDAPPPAGTAIAQSPVPFNYIAGPANPNPPVGVPDRTNLSITKDPAVANGSDADKVKAHITDINGNVVANGTPVRFVITGPAGVTAVFSGNGTQAITATTTGGNTPEIPITSMKAEDVEVTAYVETSPGVWTAINGSPRTVHFVAGPVDPNPPAGTPGGTVFWTNHDNSIANGNDADLVSVHLSDKNGNTATYPGPPPVPVEVTFTITPVGTTPDEATFSNGQKTITVSTLTGDINSLPITSTAVGAFLVTATVKDPVSGADVPLNGSPQTIHFVAGPPDPNPPAGIDGTNFWASHDNALGNNSDQDKVNVIITDKDGHIKPGVNVRISVVAGGSVTGIAQYNYNGGFQPATVGTYFNLVTGLDGKAELPLISPKSGDLILMAEVEVSPGVWAEIKGSKQTIHFVANIPDPNPGGSAPDPTFYVVKDDNATANGVAQNTVWVHLTDGNSAIPNYTVTFEIIDDGSPAAANAKFSNGGKTISASTGPNGEDIILPIMDTKVGDVKIKATVVINGVTYELVNSPRTVHFVVGNPDPNPPGDPAGGTDFWVSQDNAVADEVAQDSLKVHISDATGNAIIGQYVEVTFTITGGSASAYAVLNVGGAAQGTTYTYKGLTNELGNVAIAMTDKKSGPVIVKAELNGVEVHNSPQTGHFVAGPAVPSAPGAIDGLGTLLYVKQNNRPADGKKVDSVRAFITDKNGNPVSGQTVSFSIIPGGDATNGALFQPAKVATSVTIVTNDSGYATIAISNTMSGDVWVIASIEYGGAATLIDGSHVIAKFSQAPDVTNPDTRLIVILYQALADGTSVTSVKAHVVDKAGSPLPDWDVTFMLDSGKATIITPQPVTTDENGDAIITIVSTTPGYALITATVNDEAITFGSPARVRFSAINIYVPRVFTPNGDGTNDQLKPILVGIAEFHYFSIYNRWGNLIYTSQDPNRGWDGRFKGVPQPVETYLWIAEGIDVKGNKIVQKGMVSLVK